jgi:hypothetical protein
VRKTHLYLLRCQFILKMIMLPRQARDKHRGKSTQKKRSCFFRRLPAHEQARCAISRCEAGEPRRR